jgi:hypothetical protein
MDEMRMLIGRRGFSARPESPTKETFDTGSSDPDLEKLKELASAAEADLDNAIGNHKALQIDLEDLASDFQQVCEVSRCFSCSVLT